MDMLRSSRRAGEQRDRREKDINNGTRPAGEGCQRMLASQQVNDSSFRGSHEPNLDQRSSHGSLTFINH